MRQCGLSEPNRSPAAPDDLRPLPRPGGALHVAGSWPRGLDHIHDLIALTIGSTADAMALARARGGRAAACRRSRLMSRGMSATSGLTIAAIAARHGVTPRYIHKLFETEDVTFTEFVLVRRLDLADRLLNDSAARAPLNHLDCLRCRICGPLLFQPRLSWRYDDVSDGGPDVRQCIPNPHARDTGWGLRC